MHGLINLKSPNNTSKWQMEFNSAFKGLRGMYPHRQVSGFTANLLGPRRYRGVVEMKLHAFITSAANGVEWSATRIDRCTPGEIIPLLYIL
jgi:hypothetical protein